MSCFSKVAQCSDMTARNHFQRLVALKKLLRLIRGATLCSASSGRQREQRERSNNALALEHLSTPRDWKAKQRLATMCAGCTWQHVPNRCSASPVPSAHACFAAELLPSRPQHLSLAVQSSSASRAAELHGRHSLSHVLHSSSILSSNWRASPYVHASSTLSVYAVSFSDLKP